MIGGTAVSIETWISREPNVFFDFNLQTYITAIQYGYKLIETTSESFYIVKWGGKSLFLTENG